MRTSADLRQAQVGKPVFNRNGRQIGRVVRVHLADNYLREDEPKQTSSNELKNNKEWLALIADVIEPDDRRSIELAKEMWHQGFLKITGDRLRGYQHYVLPNQITKIDEKGVHLNVSH